MSYYDRKRRILPIDIGNKNVSYILLGLIFAYSMF